MRCADVSATMPSACFAASAKDKSEKGATSPGRWHGAQFAKTIGATSLLNVTAGAGGADWPHRALDTASAAARPNEAAAPGQRGVNR